MMGNGRMTNTWELVSIRFSLLFAFASKSQICGIAVCHGNVFFFFPNVRGCQTVAEIAMHMKVICDLIVHGLLEVAFTVVVVIESSLSWNVFFFYSNVRVQTAGEFALDMKMIFHLTVCMACQKFALEAKFMMAMCVCVCMHACIQWPNGAMYSGEWRENKMHGNGTYVDKEGNTWVGQFFNGTGPGLVCEIV